MVKGNTKTISVPDSRLLEALSQALRYPVDGLAETTAALEGLAGDGAGMTPEYAALARKALASAGEFESRTAEQLAYTRLFIGSMHMEAPPYASYYLEREHTLFGQAAVEVESVYRQFGIELGSSEIEPPDHLRFLVAFLALLARRFEETGEPAFAEAYADFNEEYILTWIDECKALVDRCAEEPYYPALMELIVAVLKDGSATSALTGD